jgi:purine-binding chemotaxis protein CheW
VVTSVLDLGSRAHAMRGAFDRAFSEPHAHAAASTEDLLAVGVAGDAYALKVSELAGLVYGRKIVALPSRAPHLLGIAGVRGALVPVYALAGVLGYEGARSAAPWLALCGRQDPVALAFEQLDGFLRVPRTDLHPVGSALSRQHVAEGVRTGGVVRRVVDTRSVLAALQGGAGIAGTAKER